MGKELEFPCLFYYSLSEVNWVDTLIRYIIIRPPRNIKL